MAVDAGTAVVRTVLQLSQSSVNQVSKEAEKTIAGSMRNIGASTARVGAGLTLGVTAPILGAGAGVIKLASDFEAGMLKVSAVTQATDDQIASLTDKAQELGASTIFSAREAAEGMEALGLAGFDTNDIMKSIDGTLALAATENIEMGKAASITAKSLATFGLEAGKAGDVANILAQASIDTQTSAEGLGSALAYSGSQAHLAGLDVEEATAALGILAKTLPEGTSSGTAFNNMLRGLQDPSDKLQAQLDKFGVSVQDASGEVLPLTEIMAQFGDTAPEAIREISNAMEIRGGRAFRALGEAGPKELSKLEESLRGAQDGMGTATEVAEKLTSGTAGALEEMSSAFEGLSIAIADSGLLQFFTDIVKSVTDFIRNLSESNPELLKWGTVIAAALAAIGPFLVVIGSVVSAIGTIAPVIGGALAAITGPVGLVIAGIVALGVAFAAAYAKSEPFRDFINSIGEALQSFGKGFLSGFMEFIDPVVALFQDELGPMFAETGAKLEEFFAAVAPIIQKALPYIEIIGQAVGRVFGVVITSAISLVVNAFQSVYNIISGVTDAIIGVFTGIFTGDWSKAAEGFTQIMEGIFDAILAVASLFGPQVLEFFTGLFEDVVNFIKDFLGISSPSKLFLDIATDMFQGLINGAKSMLSKVVAIVRTIFNNVVSTITGFIRGMVARGRDFINNLVSGIRDRVSRIRETVRGGVQQAVNAVINLAGNMASRGREFISNLINGLRDRVGSIRDTVRDGVQRAVDAIKNFDLWSAGRDLVQGLINGLGSMLQNVKNKASEIAGAVRNFFPGSPVKEGPLVSWNNGGAGRQLGGLLADGLLASRSDVSRAAGTLAGSVNQPGAVRGGSAVGRGAAGVGGASVVQNFYGPQTGAAQVQEINWATRYATSLRKYGDPAVVI